ncbi:MAG TPA: histidine phosphatase family protein [Thermomicrobiales bacterium]|nr:histidine phosphatase family protein [Thermomicrobiales bacterium]
MQLLLVRHGESAGNVTRELQRRDDPLTERGRRQAREIAAHLAARGDVRALYASPLPRAYETALTIGAAVDLVPLPRENLAEIDVGRAAGETFADWAARHPDAARRFAEEGVDFAWPGGESGRQLGARTAAEVDRIIGANRLEPGAVVVVSHGGALAWIVAHLLREPRDAWPAHQFDHCALTEVTIDPHDQQAVAVVCQNETGHLSAEPAEGIATGRAGSGA